MDGVETTAQLTTPLSASAFMRHLLSLKSPRVRLLLVCFTLWPSCFETPLPAHSCEARKLQKNSLNFQAFQRGFVIDYDYLDLEDKGQFSCS